MIANMANNLPNPRRVHSRLQRHHIPVIETLTRHIQAPIRESIPMHMEHMTRASKTVHVPDCSIVGAGLERGRVSEDVAVESVEGWGLGGGEGDGGHVH